MNSRVPKDIRDPHSLAAKNPRRVAPAVRRNIQIQRFRIRGHAIATLLLVLASVVSMYSSWIPGGIEVLCLMLTPFTLIGVYGDWRVLVWQRARLAECERRIAEEDANPQP